MNLPQEINMAMLTPIIPLSFLGAHSITYMLWVKKPMPTKNTIIEFRCPPKPGVSDLFVSELFYIGIVSPRDNCYILHVNLWLEKHLLYSYR